MLVIGRKVDESFTIGDDIEIMIVGIRYNTVKIGIKAPKNIPIHRNEIVIKLEDNEKQK